MEDSVIGLAKKYALTKGKSLSDIVENYLISITSDDQKTISPEIRKMMGVIKLPEHFDYKKFLGEALSKKYSK